MAGLRRAQIRHMAILCPSSIRSAMISVMSEAIEPNDGLLKRDRFATKPVLQVGIARPHGVNDLPLYLSG